MCRIMHVCLIPFSDVDRDTASTSAILPNSGGKAIRGKVLPRILFERNRRFSSANAVHRTPTPAAASMPHSRLRRHGREPRDAALNRRLSFYNAHASP